MNPEQNDLQEILRLTRENNEMLHGMRSREKIANTFRILYWLFIFLSIFGTYYYVQPYLVSLLDTLNSMNNKVSGVQNISNSLTGFGDVNNLKNILNTVLK
jgi:hypothetical protein